MDPTLPSAVSGPGPMVLPPRRTINLVLILAIVFGVGTVVFALLAIVAFSSSQHDRSTLNAARAAAYQSGKSDQQKSDQAAAQSAAESPYRSYTAPSTFGGFQIVFPKNWNVYAIENDSSGTQVNLSLNPDLIKQVSGGNSDNVYAATVQLVARQAADYLTQFQSLIKSGKLQSSSVTVSGIVATNLVGQYDGKHSGRVVVVPVRDKTMVFTTTGHTYDSEFSAILTQSKINP